jgi:hypothetical protein
MRSEQVWEGVGRLVDRTDGARDLEAHGLHLLAAERWRRFGRPVPQAFVQEELRAAMTTLAAPALLRRVRASCEGPMLVLKGVELARRYPDPALRLSSDVDLLVRDAEAAQRALLAAGFVEVGDPELYLDIHHLRPLCWPTLPLAIELHSRIKWPDGLQPPPSAELFADAVPAAVGLDGVLALPAAQHALAVAAHAWAHVPLRRLRDLVDIALLSAEADPGELSALARRWGIERLWRTTRAAVEGVLLGAVPPAAVQLWARHLADVRERTVLENHLMRCLSPLWALPPRRALAASLSALVDEVRPGTGETWRTKLARGGEALRNPKRQLSEHDRTLRSRRLSG